MRFGVAALVAMATLSGCAVHDQAGDHADLDRAKGLPGVLAVKVRPTMWDIEPRTADDVHVLMDSSSKPEDVVAVANAYADETKHGEVQMLAIVAKGASPYRSRLYPDGRVTRGMAEDLLAAADDPNMIRYGDEHNPYLLDFALAKADLQSLATAVDQKLRIDGVKAVRGESGSFNIQVDPVNEDARLARRRLKFALEMNRHIRLTGANIGGYVMDPNYGGLELRVAEADLDAATKYVRTHRTPDLRQILINPAQEPPIQSSAVWLHPYPSAEELAAGRRKRNETTCPSSSRSRQMC